MKRYSIFFPALAILLILFSIWSAEPPAVVKGNIPDSLFSVKRAYIHLQQVARAPHSIGTAEHAHVREYIINAFKQLGLTPEIQNTTVVERYNESMSAANVTNIIVYIKGTVPGKAILMAAHYDSQPNTPGAGDDGMGVAALLETTRALKASHPLQHDLILLISDGEEEGLFGATAFVNEHPSLKDVAVVINWDFRGNSGMAVTYETSAENGWLMKQYAKGAVYPSASSMAYEISKRIPNDADFTPFKKAGVTGFANGAIDGFVNYHSMTDKPENLDQRSLQQVGSNMLGLVKQLGNISLEDTKAADLSYFNFIGSWFIYYPASWNLFIVLAASLLLVTAIFKGFREKQIKLPGFIISTIALPLVCVAANFASAYTLKAVLNRYPLYSHFYENNSYNSHWYFLTMTMLALLLFFIVYRPIFKRWGYSSSFSGILLNIAAFMWLAWLFIPSATFLCAIPCLFLSAGFVVIQVTGSNLLPGGFLYNGINFVSSIPGLLLFSPLCYILFITFGLGNTMPFVSIAIVLTAALLYPVFTNTFTTRRWVIPSVCITLLVLSLLMAHINSGFDKKHPLHTNVRYRLNANDSTADWLSDFSATDVFSEKFFPDKKIDTSVKGFERLIHSAPALSYSAPTLFIVKDTIYPGKRELTLRCAATRSDVTSMGIILDEDSLVRKIIINGKEADSTRTSNKNSYAKYVIFYGVPQQGFDIRFEMKIGSKLGLSLFDRSRGLPAIKNLTEYPEDVIPGTDFNCNTVMVRKHFLL